MHNTHKNTTSKTYGKLKIELTLAN